MRLFIAEKPSLGRGIAALAERGIDGTEEHPLADAGVPIGEFGEGVPLAHRLVLVFGGEGIMRACPFQHQPDQWLD